MKNVNFIKYNIPDYWGMCSEICQENGQKVIDIKKEEN